MNDILLRLTAVGWILSFIIKGIITIAINRRNNNKNDLDSWDKISMMNKTGNAGDKFVLLHNTLVVMFYIFIIAFGITMILSKFL